MRLTPSTVVSTVAVVFCAAASLVLWREWPRVVVIVLLLGALQWLLVLIQRWMSQGRKAQEDQTG